MKEVTNPRVESAATPAADTWFLGWPNGATSASELRAHSLAQLLDAINGPQVNVVTLFGADPTFVNDSTPAFQAAIDWILNAGATNPATQTRTARASLYVPAGTYKITAPLRIHSAIYFTMRGEGMRTRLRADGTFDRVLDINGCAYSLFENFIIVGGNTAAVQEVLRLEWFDDGAGRPARSSTQNRFRNIEIREFGSFVDGFSCGKNSGSTQVDHITFEHCFVGGSWSAGNTTTFQHAFRVGGNLSGNQLNYFFHSCSATRVRHGCASYGALPVTWIGGGFVDNEFDFYTSGQAHLAVHGTRSEGSQRFYSDAGGGSYANLIAFRNCRMALNGIAADDRVIRHRTGGSLIIENFSFSTLDTPIVYVDTSAHVAVFHRGCSSLASASAFVTVTNPSTCTLSYDGYVQINGSSVATSASGAYFSKAVEIDGALDHDGSTVGFYGTTPVAKQTGVAVTAEAIHAALVNLGLISA